MHYNDFMYIPVLRNVLSIEINENRDWWKISRHHFQKTGKKANVFGFVVSCKQTEQGETVESSVQKFNFGMYHWQFILAQRKDYDHCYVVSYEPDDAATG